MKKKLKKITREREVRAQKCNKKCISTFFRGSGDHFQILTEEKNGEDYWVSPSGLGENIVSA